MKKEIYASNLEQLESQLRQLFTRTLLEFHSHVNSARILTAYFYIGMLIYAALIATIGIILFTILFPPPLDELLQICFGLLLGIAFNMYPIFKKYFAIKKHFDASNNMLDMNTQYMKLLSRIHVANLKDELLVVLNEDEQKLLQPLPDNFPKNFKKATKKAQIELQLDNQHTFSDIEIDRLLPDHMKMQKLKTVTVANAAAN